MFAWDNGECLGSLDPWQTSLGLGLVGPVPSGRAAGLAALLQASSLAGSVLAAFHPDAADAVHPLAGLSRRKSYIEPHLRRTGAGVRDHRAGAGWAGWRASGCACRPGEGRLAWGLALVLFAWSARNNYDLVFNQYQRGYELSAWNTSEMGGVVRDFGALFGRRRPPGWWPSPIGWTPAWWG